MEDCQAGAHHRDDAGKVGFGHEELVSCFALSFAWILFAKRENSRHDHDEILSELRLFWYVTYALV